jgi:hypothetical protein
MDSTQIPFHAIVAAGLREGIMETSTVVLIAAAAATGVAAWIWQRRTPIGTTEILCANPRCAMHRKLQRVPIPNNSRGHLRCGSCGTEDMRVSDFFAAHAEWNASIQEPLRPIGHALRRF